MDLYKLLKDMLVILVSNIREETKREYEEKFSKYESKEKITIKKILPFILFY
jgi:hypothetical protein